MFYALVLSLALLFSSNVMAQEEVTIRDGVYAEEISLSGMSKEAAAEEVAAYIRALADTEIILLAANDAEVAVTAGEFGLYHANEDLVDRALALGNKGNVMERYKWTKILENEGHHLPIEIGFDKEMIAQVLAEKGAKYDVEPKDVSLVRENGVFTVRGGQKGLAVDVETSANKLYDYLSNTWDESPVTIGLELIETEYQGDAEELAQVKDLLGSFATSYRTSGASRVGNVENGVRLIDATILYPGEEFSALEIVTPFTEENGYFPAGSYLNGQVVDSLGGGICQVTTTLYNAVLLAELEVTQRYNHSMTVGYVDLSADAAIAESAGKDFKFVNNTNAPIYIEGVVQNKVVTFNIYGKEERNLNRKVRYESVVLEVVEKGPDSIVADVKQPLGHIKVHSGYTGYKAQLWKVVTENGVEVSRTRVNSSNYKMVNTVAEVGVVTPDPQAYEELMAAISTANIDHVRNVVAQLQSRLAQ